MVLHVREGSTGPPPAQLQDGVILDDAASAEEISVVETLLIEP